MVKLGSLYNRNTANGTNDRNIISSSAHDLLQENTRNHYRDRLEFNQRVQEQRLLAEERKDWDRLSPDHGKLQVNFYIVYSHWITCIILIKLLPDPILIDQR